MSLEMIVVMALLPQPDIMYTMTIPDSTKSSPFGFNQLTINSLFCAVVQSGSDTSSFTAYTASAGGLSFSALRGLPLPSSDNDRLSKYHAGYMSSGESYTIGDRFALPGPTWCQQFAILLRRILRTRRFEVLSVPDATLVLVVALITGEDCGRARKSSTSLKLTRKFESQVCDWCNMDLAFAARSLLQAHQDLSFLGLVYHECLLLTKLVITQTTSFAGLLCRLQYANSLK